MVEAWLITLGWALVGSLSFAIGAVPLLWLTGIPKSSLASNEKVLVALLLGVAYCIGRAIGS